MDASDLKRQILIASETTGIRKKIVTGESGMRSEDVIEMGKAFEQLVATKGWTYIEAYILQQANPMATLFGADAETLARARGLVLLMQHVDAVIRAKNDLMKDGRTEPKEAA